MRLYAIAAAALGAAAGCRPAGDGLEKYPVTGTVTVNGKPAPLVAVQFEHTDQNLPGRNARRPVGVTGDDGGFALSTNGDGDGAVPGEYVVTFLWLSANSPTASDRFGGAFEKAAASKFRATVRPEENRLPPFELKFDESRARRAPAERAAD